MKIKCDNLSCVYCVRTNPQIRSSYRCILDEVKLEIPDEGSKFSDDRLSCLNFEHRFEEEEL